MQNSTLLIVNRAEEVYWFLLQFISLLLALAIPLAKVARSFWTFKLSYSITIPIMCPYNLTEKIIYQQSYPIIE